MKKHRGLLLLGSILRLLLLTILPSFCFAESPELSALFPKEADVVAEKTGMTRLALPTEVLADCKPDLSDLRVFDHVDREVPYLVDSGAPRPAVYEVVQSEHARILGVDRNERRSEEGPPIFTETYEITPPSTAATSGHWQLIVRTRKPTFVRRLTVREKIDGQEIVRAEESLFNLGAEAKTAIVLDETPTGTLLVTLSGADGSYVEPEFEYASTRKLEPPSELVVILEEVRRERNPDQPGVLDIYLRRPRGIVPDRLRIETSTPTFSRHVHVDDVRRFEMENTILDRANLYRLAGSPPLAQLEVQVAHAEGDEIKLEMVDGDSPPLADLKVHAIVRHPVLLFTLPGNPDGRVAGTLRFGGGRAHLPRYDVAALLPRAGAILQGMPAEAALRILDRTDIGTAQLGDPRANPTFDGRPVLAFAMRPGANIDNRVFSHRRRLMVQPSSDGLSRVDLGPEDLAVARADLADIRISDDQGRQWPYLLERDIGSHWQRVKLQRTTERRISRYQVELTASPSTIAQMRLSSSGNEHFDRAYRVVAKTAEGERSIANGRIALDLRYGREININLSPVRATELHLVIEDGDEAPLEIDGARVRYPVPALFLTAPAGQYWLLSGSDSVSAPRYDIEQIRGMVLSVRAGDSPGGNTEANPGYSLQARLTTGGTESNALQQALLWGAILLAVFVLTGLTLRLARQ